MQASKQASHSKQASQRTTYNTMKSVMAASTCTMRCHKSSNSIQFTIQTQQLRILLNALFTHLSSVYYADRSLLCTPLVRLVRGGGALTKILLKTCPPLRGSEKLSTRSMRRHAFQNEGAIAPPLTTIYIYRERERERFAYGALRRL